MTDYGRKPKDYSLRFIVVENHETVIPGCVFIGVRQVNGASAFFGAVIGPTGEVFTMPYPSPPVEAVAHIDDAKARVKRIAMSRMK